MLNRATWPSIVLLAALSNGCVANNGEADDGFDPADDRAAELTSGGTYFVKNVNSGKCLDVKDVSTADGANLQQWSCGSGANQKFKITSVGSGVYTLSPTNSGKCVDIAGQSTADGANAQQWHCNNQNNQRFKMVSKGSGQYELVAAHSGKCLDLAEWTTADGGNVQQWSCHGGKNQLFTFSKSSTPTPDPTPNPTPTPGTGNFPARFAAPYVAVWNDNNLVDLSNATGNKFWTLAFIINGSGSCNPMWNGDTSLGGNAYGSYIANLQKMGGDVIVSFGGASGTELGKACGSVESLQAAYQKVISQFHLSYIDLDIESGQESDTASVDRRNKALHNLQSANPGLKVSYTLAVDRSGLPSAQRNLLANAKSNGVDVSVVNIMAMDYDPCYSDMGQAAVDAANATRSQLSSLGLSSRVGVTPMIGTNDTTCEKFSTSDAHVLVDYAQANSFIQTLAYWVQDSDPSHSYISVFKTFH